MSPLAVVRRSALRCYFAFASMLSGAALAADMAGATINAAQHHIRRQRLDDRGARRVRAPRLRPAAADQGPGASHAQCEKRRHASSPCQPLLAVSMVEREEISRGLAGPRDRIPPTRPGARLIRPACGGGRDRGRPPPRRESRATQRAAGAAVRANNPIDRSRPAPHAGPEPRAAAKSESPACLPSPPDQRLFSRPRRAMIARVRAGAPRTVRAIAQARRAGGPARP